jgi:hypothetical protein
MLWRLLLRKVYIPLSSPARMKVCIFLTRTRRGLWNDVYIVTCSGLQTRRADVSRASSTCAICAVAMVARDAFTDDLAIYISELK